MTMESTGLRKLHQLHLRLRAVQEKLEKGPRQLKTRRQAIDKKAAELETQSAALRQTRMSADAKNLQLKSNEAKLKTLEKRLNEAASGKEYEILRSQIQADTMAKSVLEDEILETLEKADAEKASQVKLEGEIATARQDLEKLTTQLAEAEPPLRQEIVELEAALRACEGDLPGTVLEPYRRLVQAHGADALSPVENKACTQCYTMLSSQDYVNVTTGRFVFCRTCGRLLYAPPEAP